MADINDNLQVSNSKLNHIITSLKLSQIIDKPTRITATTQSLLDVIITSTSDKIVDFQVLPCQIGDHELISATIDLKKPKCEPKYRTFRSLRNYSQVLLCDNILEETFTLNSILNTDDVNQQVKTVTTVLGNTINNCAPEVTSLIRRPPAPWIDGNVKKIIKERDQIQRLLKEDTLNLNLREEYKC